jgi:DNA-binding transcriptional regulator GbsR (MarR family)
MKEVSRETLMSDEVTTLELQFAEDMGRFFETGGLARMAGRVWAMLLVMDEQHVSAADLQEALGASAGSISGATRSLLQLGLIERVNVRGERRDYFAPRHGAIANILRLRLERLVVVEDLLSEALEAFRDRENAVPYLQEVHDVYHWYARELPKLHERFLAAQRAGRLTSDEKEG